jgi:thiol:disulfide interchange protein DsbD
MERVKKIFGVLILLLAAWYARSALSLAIGSRSAAAEGRGAPPGFTLLDFATPDAQTRMDALLAQAADSGTPVLLDFGAHWCKVCALMEATTLRDPQVTAALEGTLALSILADDPASPAAAPLLARHSVHGYPAYRLLLPD